MADEWRTTTFGGILSEPVRTGIYKPKEFHGRGMKIVNMGELFAHPRLHPLPMKRVELSGSEVARFGLVERDLLFARRSLVAEGAGKCCIVLAIEEPTTFESSIIRARPDCAKADSLFLYYFFNSPHGLHALDTIRRQVAVAGITGGDLAKLKITLPQLPEQRAIAHILGTLDDKIELNRRMSETLEAMARALFKSWFVDFDPVRAKAAVRRAHPSWTNEQVSRAACPNLKPEIAELFPDSFEDSKLGEIPRGWKVRPIGDVVQILGGGTPSTKEPAYWEGSIHPFCTPKDMASLTDPVLLQTERHLTDKGLAKVSSGQLPLGTVLLSSRAPIGYLAVAETPISINQGIIAMVCDGELPNLYVLHWTKSNMDRILTNANGSTFMEISKRNFRPIAAVVPSPEVLNDFMRVVEPMHRRVVSSLKQIRQLANLRDFLLPRLISGDLVVAEGERIVGRIST